RTIPGVALGQASAPLSVTPLDRAGPGEEGRATSGLQLFDVLGQAVGTGVGGAIVAGTADALGHRAGAALAFAFALLVSTIALLAGVRPPPRLRGHEPPAPGPAAPE